FLRPHQIQLPLTAALFKRPPRLKPTASTSFFVSFSLTGPTCDTNFAPKL
ncbi:hypothetical protein Gorai_019997, partial [Gossypium raimondii]|nr:hypothetical protein [Gossypium raimondii]